MTKVAIDLGFSLAAFQKWTGTTISFGFYESASDLPAHYSGHIAPTSPSNTLTYQDLFMTFTNYEKSYVRALLSLSEGMIGSSFSETPNSTSSNLTFGTLNEDWGGAFASLGAQDTIISGDVYGAAGDVWLSLSTNHLGGYDYRASTQIEGDYFEGALPHEIGHALGLAHTFDVGLGTGADNIGSGNTYNNHKYSIMAYQKHKAEESAAWEFQILDIAALQKMYGRNDDIEDNDYDMFEKYDLTQSGVIIGTGRDRIFSIWDGGGTDSVIASDYSGSSYIDLRPGHFSSIGPEAFTANSIGTVGAVNANWTVSYGQGGLGRENVSVAFGAYIENAVGGNSNDVIVGNLLSNSLQGLDGHDLIFADGFGIELADKILVEKLGKMATGLSSELYSSSADADYRQIQIGGVGAIGAAAAAFVENPSRQQNTLVGGDGDDLLIGSNGQDILDGGNDNDVLIGGDGRDTLVGGDGVDYLQGDGGNDRLSSGKGNDRDSGSQIAGVYGGTGNDLLVTELNDGDDYLDGGVNGFDIFDGTDTVVYKYALGNSSIEITEGAGDDGQKPGDFGITITGARDASGNTGTFGNDVLKSIEKAAVEAGSGADNLILTGKSYFGSLNYIDLGFGVDVLDAFNLATNITLDLRDADNQLLTVNDGFFVDTEVKLRNIENAVGSEFDDIMYAAEAGSHLSGAGGEDELHGGSGDDTLLGGSNADLLIGGAGADTLDGGSGADILVVDGLDTLARGDIEDRLYWKAYDLWSKGNNLFRGGSRTVDVDDEQSRDQQIQAMLDSDIPFKGAMGETYEVIGSGTGQGLKITLKSGEVVNIPEWSEGEYGIYLETRKNRVTDFQPIEFPLAGYPSSLFAVGLVFTVVINSVLWAFEEAHDPNWVSDATDTFRLSQLQQWANEPGQPPLYGTVQGSGSADTLNGRSGDDRILAGGGDDTVHGGLGDDYVEGSNGNDSLFGDIGADRLEGGSGNDLLDGGLGNDTIVAGSGADTIIVRAGEGSDVIIADTQDVIRFENVNSTEVTTQRGAGGAPAYGEITTGNLSFSFGGDRITIEGGAFKSIEFADGVVKTAAILARDAITAATTSGDDAIVGFGTADRLAGGAGNDYLNGIGGNDVYYFASGDGHDRIEDNEGIADRLVFGAGITADDIVVSTSRITEGPRMGDVLLRLAIEGTDDWVEFVARDIEDVHFADGTVWDSNEISDLAYRALSTSGDDVISINNYLNGEFRPGGGDDRILVGTMSVARIEFGRGSDLDRIELSNKFDGWSDDLEGYGGFTHILLDADLSLGDLTVARLGDGFSIGIEGTSDRVEVVRNYDASIGLNFRNVDILLYSSSTTLASPVLGSLADAAGGVTQRLNGTSGSDALSGTGANEWIAGGGETDTLTGGGGVDLLFGGAGDDILDGGADRDLLFGEDGSDQLSGGAGNDSLYAGTGADTLLGGDGEDELFGNGESVLNGGAGDDKLTVVNGDDIVYNLGDGVDTIDFQGESVSVNGSLAGLNGSTAIERSQIELGAGIDPALTTLTLEGWSVFININGSTDNRIRLDRQFQSGNLPEIHFENGTVWQQGEIYERLFSPDHNDDTPEAVFSPEPQRGGNLVGYIFGGGGNDVLSDAGFYSSYETNYVFAPGSGNDVIEDSIRTGKLHLHGFDPDQVTIARSGSGLGDITLSFSGSTDTIKIESQQRANGSGTVSDFYFSGARLLASDIRAMWIAQSETAGDDTITGFDGPGGFVDIGFVPGVSYSQRPGNDRLEGGLGNDLMIGGSGDDTYVVNIGDGIDTIRDVGLFSSSGYAGYDILVTDAISGNAQFKRSASDANDLLITFAGSSDQVTVDQFFAVGVIEEFRFGDGVVLSALDVQQLALGGSVTSGNDVIKGTSAPETLTGGAGADTLDGLGGSDRYLFNLGDGADVVTDTGTAESNTLAFGAGIAASQVIFQRVGNALKATVNGSDSITVNGQFSGSTRRIGYAVFADGTRLSAAEIDQLALASAATSGNDSVTGFASNDVILGDGGNDTLNGGAGSDTLNGGTGNDRLNGQQGADVYLIARGDGTDTIASTGDATAADVVRFTGDIDQRDIAFVRPTPTSPDLIVQIRGTSQSITVTNYFGGLAVKQFEFSDGTILGTSEVSAALANTAPTASGQAWRLTLREGGVGRLAVPSGLFADDMPAGELSYNATMADGSPLPAWLTFDGHVFQSSADDADVGTYSVKLIATDRFGASVERLFALDIVNRDEAPEAAASIITQSAPVAQAFNFALPSGLFTDDDQQFASVPALAADTYTSVHGGSFVVLSDGSFTYTPAGAYTGDDSVHISFDIGNAQPIEVAYAFESTGTVSTGTVPGGLAPAGDSLTITARLANGDPLPSWLNFDGSCFSGTPTSGDEGPLAVEIVATDDDGRQAIIPFAIRVGTANSAPMAGSLPSLAAVQGEEFSYTLATSLFTDADTRDRLTLAATMADGSPLPSWLSFDGESFAGTPANGDVGSISVRVTATDIWGTSTSALTTLTIGDANDAPVIGMTIADQLATQDQAFSFTVPTGSFADPDTGDTLTLSATLDTGDPLPSWLQFANGVFSGTPDDPDTGLIRIRVTATDVGGKTAEQFFYLGVSDVNDAPTVAETHDVIEAPADETTIFRIPSSLFADSDDSGYRLSVDLADGSPLPDWIDFDPNAGTIRIAPGTAWLAGRDATASELGIRITATDSRGATVSTVLETHIVAPRVDDTIVGSGSSSITGSSLSERIDSGSGNNTIRGNGGVDRIVFGRNSGQDRLYRASGTTTYPLGDIVELAPDITLADLVFTRVSDTGGSQASGQNLQINIVGSTAWLRIMQQFGGMIEEEPTVRELVFADGTRVSAAQLTAMFAQSTGGDDLVRGGNQDDILSGGAGNDTIWGFDGDDLIDGGAGNDVLVGDRDSSGFGGSDTFLFGIGSGNDVVFADSHRSTELTNQTGLEFQPQRGIDTLRFGAGIAPEDLIVTHIPGYPSENLELAGPPEGSLLIQIAGTTDSIRIDHQFYLRHFFQGDVSTPGIDRFEFADGTIMNRAEFEALITLAPTTSGDDLIAGGAGADRLAGGLGNDTLVGEDGADTYVYSAGDGDDRIIETMQIGRATPSSSSTELAGDIVSFDALSFGAGINPEDLIFTRPDAAGETLVISFTNRSGSITIENQFRNIFQGADMFGGLYDYFGRENAAIDEFRFANGTRWTLSDIYAFSTRGTTGNDIVDGFFRPSERLDGGAGNDLLSGRNGDDTYVFGRGYGHDRVKEIGWHYADGATTGDRYSAMDKIEFVGVASTDITTSIGAGGSFIFTITDTGETLTILAESEFSNFTSIIFSDTTWNAAQFQARWTVAAATSGDDVINGFVGNDTISGGDGNDTLQGGQNTGTPQTGVGYDTLNGGNGNDTLTLESSDNDRANGDAGDDIFRIDMTLPYWKNTPGGVDPDRGRLDYPDFVEFGTERGVIDGGSGNDLLVLGGQLSDYWMSEWWGEAYVEDNGDGSYSFKGGLTVRDIETVQFADTTVPFATLVAATSPISPLLREGASADGMMTETADTDPLYRTWTWGDYLAIDSSSYSRTDGFKGAFGDVALYFDPRTRQPVNSFFLHDRARQDQRASLGIDRAAARFGEAIAGFMGGSAHIDELRFDENAMKPRDFHFVPVRELPMM